MYKRQGNRGAIHILNLSTSGGISSTSEINDNTSNGPTLSDGDQFGHAIANMGDLDGDGVRDLAVGAPYDDGSQSDTGAVHILFMNSNNSVKSTVQINDSTSNGPTLGYRSYFGVGVENIGDLNGDGVTDLAVGASGDNKVYLLFMNSNGSVKSTASISGFGAEDIANMGDLNGDGVNDLAVGYYADTKVTIFFMNTDGTYKSFFTIDENTTNVSGVSQYSFFGASVANIGDFDGDGVNDLAVGNTSEDKVHILRLQESSDQDQVYFAVTTITKNYYSTQSANYDQNSIQIFSLDDPTGDSCDRCGFTLKDADSYQDDGFTTIYNQNDIEAFYNNGVPYALSASTSNAKINVFDMENAAYNEIIDTFSHSGANDLEIYNQGATQYALVGGQISSGLTRILNISDPANISETGYISTATDSQMTRYATWVDTLDYDGRRLAIAASNIDDGAVLIDINDPASPYVLDKIVKGQYYIGLDNPAEVLAFESDGRDFIMVFDSGREMEILELSSGSDQISFNVGKVHYRTESLVLSDSIIKNKHDVQTVLSEMITLSDQILAAREIFLSQSLNMTTTFSRIYDARKLIEENILLTGTPAKPVALDFVSGGSDGFSEFNSFSDISIVNIGSSTYALVADYGADRLLMIDVSDPNNISQTDSITDSDSGTLKLDGTQAVDTFVVGASTYAIVSGYADNGISVLNISNPNSISEVSSLSDGVGEFAYLSTVSDIATFSINGTSYAALASYSEDAITIVNLSDPSSPSLASSITGDVPYLNGIQVLDVFNVEGGTYLAAGNILGDAVGYFEVSDSGVISYKKNVGEHISDGSGYYDNVRGVAGYHQYPDYFIVSTAYDESAVQISQITSSSTLQIKGAAVNNSGFNELARAWDVEVFKSNDASVHKDTYAIIAGYNDAGLEIVDITNSTSISAVGVARDGNYGFNLVYPIALEVFEIGGNDYAIVASQSGIQMIGLQVQADTLDLTFSVSTDVSESLVLSDTTPTNKTWLIDQDDGALVESLQLSDSILPAFHQFINESLALDDDIIKKHTVKLISQSLELKSSSPDNLELLDSIVKSESGMTNHLSNVRDVEIIYVSGVAKYAAVVHDDGAWTANSAGDGISIFDISDVNNISYVTDLQIDNPYDIDINGNTAWVVSKDAVVSGSTYYFGHSTEVDISNPTNPSILNEYSYGNVVSTYDVRPTERVTAIGESRFMMHFYQQITYTGYYRYGGFGLSTSPTMNYGGYTIACSSSFTCKVPVAMEFYEVGSKDYVAYLDGTSGMIILDVTGTYPSIVATHSVGYSVTGKGMKLITAGTSINAVITTDDRILTFDITNPSNIIDGDNEVDNANGFTQLDYAKAVGVFSDDRFRYAIVGGSTSNDKGLQIVDITDYKNIQARGVLSTVNGGYVSDIETFETGYKTYALVATDNTVSNKSGLHIVEVNDASIDITYTTDSWKVSISESLALTDDEYKNTEITIEDSLSLTGEVTRIDDVKIIQNTLALLDSITKHTVKRLSDALSLTDRTIRNTKVELSDSLTFSYVSYIEAAKMIAETVALSDSIIKHVTKKIEESLGTDDYLAISKHIKIGLDESLTILDSASRAKTTLVRLDEATTLSDIIDTEKLGIVNIVESLSLGDSIIKETEITLEEVLSWNDSISKTTEIGLTESLRLDDDSSRQAQILLDENLSVSDGIIKEAGINLSENLSLTYSFVKNVPVDLEESLLLSDDSTRTTIIQISESVDFSDGISKLVGKVIEETLEMSGTVAKLTSIGISESLGLSDDATKTAGITLEENLELSDNTRRLVEINLSESLEFIDDISKLTSIGISESLGLSDTSSRTIFVDFDETLELNDSVKRLAEINLSQNLEFIDDISKLTSIGISESLTLSDGTTKTAGITLEETLGFSDSTTRTAIVTLEETLSLSDEIIKKSSIGISESLTLSDGTTKTAGITLEETLGFTDLSLIHI
ncbi:MAG: FG-GAP-like repeat-containing protein [Nitrosopumilus sp.]